MGRLEATSRRVAIALAAFPAVAVALLALCAVFPFAAFAIPPAIVGAATFGIWSARDRRRSRSR